MKKFYQNNVEEVLKLTNSSINGLSQTQAEDRLATTGENILKQKKKKKPFVIFLSQFVVFLKFLF